MHHTELVPNKPVKTKGMHHVHHEEIFTVQKFRGLKFSNFFL